MSDPTDPAALLAQWEAMPPGDHRWDRQAEAAPALATALVTERAANERLREAAEKCSRFFDEAERIDIAVPVPLGMALVAAMDATRAALSPSTDDTEADHG